MATAQSPLARQPTKLDYASPTQFRFGIHQLPKVEFFVTDVTLPGPTRSGPNSFAKEINSGVKRFLRAKIKSGIAKMWIKNQQNKR